MQDDGNFVVYDSYGDWVWATHTEGNPGAFLHVQDDGNVVVYRSDDVPLWWTDTVQATLARFVFPTNGDPAVNLSQPLQWTSVDGAQAYYLYVGTAPGSNNLVNTGEIQQTSYLATGLPAGTTLFARIWTKVSDVWYHSDIFFTGVAAASTATFISTSNGASNVDLSQPIQWTSVSGAQAYYLYVGTAPGLKNLVDTGEIQQTSYVAANLPSNQTLYARIWTEVSNVWHYSDITFTGESKATLTYPINGSADADLSRPFQWTSVGGAQAYYLYVGTAVGSKDLVDTGEIQQTSFSASGLPPIQTLYARIWTKISDLWFYADSTFSGASRATFVFPTNGAVDVDFTQPFQWTPISGAQAYYLYIGTAPELKDLVDTGEIQQTSYNALNLPAARTLHARIWTKISGVWFYSDMTFSGATRAKFVFPTNNATGVDFTQAFQWTAVSGAQAYYLYIGTAQGSKDVVNTGETLQTSYLASNLPATQTLYARIWTKISDIWFYADISFSGATRAKLIHPSNSATDVDLTQPFQWTAVSGAQAYYLYVGTGVGLKDLVDTGETLQTSYVPSNLPVAQTLYARMWTKISSTWFYADTTFSGGRKAVFTFPTNGATNVDPVPAIQWTSVSGAQAYYLYVGTAIGLKNLVDTGEIQQTSYTAPNLPAGQTVYARIWTKISDTWFYADIAFSRRPFTSRFIYPTNGATDVDLSTSFQWTSVAGAQTYYLYVGTAIGLKDLVDTGETLQTSYQVTSLPTNQNLFGRIWTKSAGIWYYGDISFTAASNCNPILAPISTVWDAEGGFDTVGVSMGSPCSWMAQSTVPWVHTSTTGSGSGTVSYTIDANTGTESRSGAITIGNSTYAVTQLPSGSECIAGISHVIVGFGANGGTDTARLSLDDECSWSVTREFDWISVSAYSGTGSGSIQITATPNQTGNLRTGRVWVGGRILTVYQAAEAFPNLNYGIVTHRLEQPYADALQSLGAGFVRLDFDWNEIEQCNHSIFGEGCWNWEPFDHWVEQANLRGQQVFATLAYSPRWANGNLPRIHPPTSIADWYNFVYRVVQRYSPKGVKYYGMWNEPDSDEFLVGELSVYPQLATQGAAAVRAADPTAFVVGPDITAKRLQELPTLLSSLEPDVFDIISYHWYPNQGWTWAAAADFVRTQSSGKPVWNTEVGYDVCNENGEFGQSEGYAKMLNDWQSRRAWLTKIFPYELYSSDQCSSALISGPDFSHRRAAFFTYLLSIITKP